MVEENPLIPNATAPPTTPPSKKPSPQISPADSTAVQYASFGRRLVALFLDALVLTFVNFLIFLVVRYGILYTLLPPNSASSTDVSVRESALYAANLASGLVPILNLVINSVYFIYLTGRRGQTLGKKALGIKVVKIGTLQQPGYMTAFLREAVGKFLSALVLLLGYLWALWDKRQQTWHDKIAGTLVINV